MRRFISRRDRQPSLGEIKNMPGLRSERFIVRTHYGATWITDNSQEARALGRIVGYLGKEVLK